LWPNIFNNWAMFYIFSKLSCFVYFLSRTCLAKISISLPWTCPPTKACPRPTGCRPTLTICPAVIRRTLILGITDLSKYNSISLSSMFKRICSKIAHQRTHRVHFWYDLALRRTRKAESPQINLSVSYF
jgi:hypothetical protein